MQVELGVRKISLVPPSKSPLTGLTIPTQIPEVGLACEAQTEAVTGDLARP